MGRVIVVAVMSYNHISTYPLTTISNKSIYFQDFLERMSRKSWRNVFFILYAQYHILHNIMLPVVEGSILHIISAFSKRTPFDLLLYQSFLSLQDNWGFCTSQFFVQIIFLVILPFYWRNIYNDHRVAEDLTLYILYYYECKHRWTSLFDCCKFPQQTFQN